MAKERKQFKYNPLDFKKDVAIGIKLPYGSKKGLFEQSYSTEDQAVSNLKNLLLTRKGERPFQPNFGADVYTLMFEQIGSTLANTMEDSLNADIKYWLPYIVIDNILVDIEEDKNYISISLKFRVTEQGANQQIIMFIDSAGVGTLQ